ncbi:MAG: methyltransferase domain-containing protein [Geobacteraceae bacterium]|nr:methyltransferase domain-containing protein [Geobacteraceae bacterium]NTW79965.1 methyltransferase domain-containing protein [Geobacteraceae bacterium]
MKQFLIPHLICPACLPGEIPLEATVNRVEADDIVTGDLFCKKCRRRFPIKDGIAILLVDPDGCSGAQRRYEESDTVNRYLWSHYADLAGKAEVAEANAAWGGCLVDNALAAFDAGCAVGRLTFEMAAKSGWAVGCDLSHNFIRTARRLARERRHSFSLQLEGNLCESFHFELPADLRSDNVEFVVADALAIPFARHTFQQISSLNLLDRVSYPLAHLYEMNRVAQSADASFLFADPFSWSTAAAPEERWLGGTAAGKYAGRGLDNVRALLEGKDKVLSPAWKIIREGCINWRMRTHTNHREIISSDFLCAER